MYIFKMLTPFINFASEFFFQVGDIMLFWILVGLVKILAFFDKVRWNIMNTTLSYPSKILSHEDLIVEVWEISVTEGIYGATRGAFTTIKEYYFPELNYSFNTHGTVNHILDPKRRYAYKPHLFHSKEEQPKLHKVVVLYGENAVWLRTLHKYILETKMKESDDRMKEIEAKLA